MAAQTVTSKDNSLAGRVAVTRSRLRIDAGQLAPKKYGDKLVAEAAGRQARP
jgi:hypothetical protein